MIVGFTDTELSILLQSSKTDGNTPDRMQRRFRAIFGTDPGVWRGKRILDLASHDGRWTYAAIKMGAAHVTGIEAREEAVEAAYANMSKFNVAPEQFTFIRSDAVSYLAEASDLFDVVLCLGFLYHVWEHFKLILLINKMQPQLIVIDTRVTLSGNLSCQVKKEKTSNPKNAYQSENTVGGYNYVATPSVPLLKSMISDIGFQMETVDWKPLLQGNPVGLKDYVNGRRITVYCRKILSH